MTPGERTAFMRGAVALVLVGGLRMWSMGPVPEAATLGSSDLPDLVRRVDEEVATERARTRPLGPDEKIDPNRADEVELDRLPGAGPAVARAVVESRSTEGGFRTPEDLLRIRGVGPATLERWRPHLEFGAGVPRTLARPAREEAGTVALNRATAADLRTLPGIGPALAERILTARSESGRFRSLEDLLAVPGIGPKTLERLRDRIRLDDR